MRNEKNLNLLSRMFSCKHQLLNDSSDWTDDYLDYPAWTDYLVRHEILFGSSDELWILLNQMDNGVLVLNDTSKGDSRFLLVPEDFAKKALVLGFLPE